MTRLLVDPPRKTHLGVGFDADRSHWKDRDAWKRTLGAKQVPARLALLPEGESRWDRVGVTAAAQVILLVFFVSLPIFFPERLQTAIKFQVIPLASPVTLVPVAPPPPPVRAKAPTPKPPEPIEEPKLNPKQPHIFVQQKVVQPKVQRVETKAPDLNPVFESAKLDTPSNQPK